MTKPRTGGGDGFIYLVLTSVINLFRIHRLLQVSYSILVFFSGMFITVEGFNSTGAPAHIWLAVEPYSRIDTRGGKVVLSLVVTFLSNVASNVPTGMILKIKTSLLITLICYVGLGLQIV